MAKVLVTGATGFIGSYLISEFLTLGHQVVATSSSGSKASSRIWFTSVSYIEFAFSDFDDAKNYFQLFDKPDIVVHLAWQGLPNYKSRHHYEENLPAHYFFLKNLVRNGARDLNVIGTCFEYGMKEGKLSEDMPTEPANAYAVAKDSLHKFLAEFRKEKYFVLKWIRLFYLFGKGQSKMSLFGQLETALSNNEEFFRMSPGMQLRDYLPVETAARYLAKISLQSAVTGAVNCCSGNPVSVKEIVDRFLALTGRKIKLDLGFYSYPEYEPGAFWGDNAKLQSILNAYRPY